MTSTIQWDEGWFSVSEQDVATDGTATVTDGTVTVTATEEKAENLVDSVESIKEWIEKDIRIQEKEKEKEIKQGKSIEDMEKRLDWLETLVHQQAETIRILGEQVGQLNHELHSTSRTSMTQLLEELKRVKERELNYALRRHQPVPFFDSGSLARIVGSVSPLFRGQMARSHIPITKL